MTTANTLSVPEVCMETRREEKQSLRVLLDYPGESQAAVINSLHKLFCSCEKQASFLQVT